MIIFAEPQNYKIAKPHPRRLIVLQRCGFVAIFLNSVVRVKNVGGLFFIPDLLRITLNYQYFFDSGFYLFYPG